MVAPTNAGLHQPFNIVSCIEFGISVFLFVARCYTAWKILHRTAIDLYLAIATFIVATISQILLILAASHGIGVHKSILSEDDIRIALLCAWLNQFFALVAIGLGKVAIVAFIVLFQGYQKRIKIIFLWFIGLSSLVFNFIAGILLLVHCRPIRKLWDEHVPGHCNDRTWGQTLGYVQGSYSAFCDIALAIYPLIIFWRVQTFSTARKIGLGCLTGFGLAAGAAAAVKTSKLGVLTDDGDITKRLGGLIAWNQAEMWMVFMAGSIPTSKPFLVFIHEKSGLASIFKWIFYKHPQTILPLRDRDARKTSMPPSGAVSPASQD